MKYLKRIASAVVCAVLMLSSAPATAFAKTTMPEYIRVGLTSAYENKQQINIQNKTLKFIDSPSDDPLDYTTISEFYSANGFAVRVGVSYQVVIPIDANGFDDAKAQADNYISQGYANALPGYNNRGWTVTIYGYQSMSEAQTAAASLGGSAVAPSDVLILSVSGDPIFLITNTDAYFAGQSADTNVDLGSREYRGIMKFQLASSGLITAVNIVDFEEYLYGVVPSEIPSSYAYEAIKAQACAARTYALIKVQKKSDLGYDICDTTHCQVYGGYTNESKTTTQAVVDTEGKAIYYNGSPVEALFSSSSGGYTEDAVNVWGNDVPYLKAVPDEYETDCQTWTRTFTLSDIDKICAAKGYNIGSATGMRITIDNKTSRVQKVEFIGTEGTKAITLESCRTVFNAIGSSLSSRVFTITNGITESGNSSSGSNSNLNVALGTFVSSPIDGYTMTNKNSYVIGNDCAVVYSTASGTKAYGADGKFVDLSKIPELVPFINNAAGSSSTSTASTGTTVIRSSGSTINISGRAIGHGVGLSQRGANGYGQLGYDYIEILQHYYTGVTVE